MRLSIVYWHHGICCNLVKIEIQKTCIQSFIGKCQRIIFNIACISSRWNSETSSEYVLQYIPRNMHTVFALLCFVVVIHWLIFPYPSGLLHWHCGNLTFAPVPAKQPWWIWINTSCEFIMNDCITTTKQSPTKPCAYFLGYTVCNTFCYLQVTTSHLYQILWYRVGYCVELPFWQYAQNICWNLIWRLVMNNVFHLIWDDIFFIGFEHKIPYFMKASARC